MAELGLEKVNTRVSFSSISWLKKRGLAWATGACVEEFLG